MYRIEGKEIWSEKSGKLVATFSDGTLAFVPGMVAQHKNKLLEYLKGRVITVNQIIGHNSVKTQEPQEAKEDGKGKTETAPVGHKMSDDDSLPPFDPRLGFHTPGFMDWKEKHTEEQLHAALKKLKAW